MSQLQQDFSELQITQGHPLIRYPSLDPPKPSEPPPTWHMLETAVRTKQPTILSYRFKIFTISGVDRELVHLAVTPHHNPCSVDTFAQLLAHDRSILNLNLGHDRTALALACFGSDPALAFFLLGEGADPNLGCWFRHSTLKIALAEQPVELIRALVEHHAETEGALNRAVEVGRVDVVRYLLGAGIDDNSIQESLEKAKEEKNEEIIALLKAKMKGESIG